MYKVIDNIEYKQLNVNEIDFSVQNIGQSTVHIVVSATKPDNNARHEFVLEYSDTLTHDDVGGILWAKSVGRNGRMGVFNGVTAIFDETNVIMAPLLNGASADMTVDGSVTPVVFSYSPPPGYTFECTGVRFYMEASTAFSAELFGDLPALANGWTLGINNTPFASAKTNMELAIIMDNVNGVTALGKEVRTLLGQLDFTPITGGHQSGLTTSVASNVSVTVNDNLSTLSQLSVFIRGFITPIEV